MSKESAEEFLYAVRNHYWFQLYLDELPVWGMVGELPADAEASRAKPQNPQALKSAAAAPAAKSGLAPGYVYTHKSFSIAHNHGQIIHVNLTSENPKPIAAGQSYPMTYSVSWVTTDHPFERRFDVYLDTHFFEHQVHRSVFPVFRCIVGLSVLHCSSVTAESYVCRSCSHRVCCASVSLFRFLVSSRSTGSRFSTRS